MGRNLEEATGEWLGIGLVVITVLWGGWRVLNWVWLKPKRIERILRQQGFNGNPYRFYYGDLKDKSSIVAEAMAKPLPFSHSNNILPRVFPYHHHILTKYGKKCFIWDGTKPVIMVMEPELIEEVLRKNNIFKKPTPSPIVRLLVSGIAGYEGEKWAKHRKIMNPAFYLDKLKHMVPAMHLCSIEMLSQWGELVKDKGSCELDVSPHLQNLAAIMIARTAFGSSYEEGRKIFELQRQLANLVFQLQTKFPGQRLLQSKLKTRIKKIHDEVQVLVNGVINQRERVMKLGEVSNDDDLLSVLLKANSKEIEEQGSKKAGMSIDDVIDECKMMYFAGQATTAQLLVWTMILLSIHKNWQIRAREEVRQVFGDKKPDYNGISHLKIVTMILNEVLRLYPPSIFMPRESSKDSKLGDMIIPAGTSIMVPTLFVHHDREIWGEDSQEFKPERFSEGIAKAAAGKKQKQAASFIPFGWGPRMCIGNNFAMLEAKVALVMILQRFSVELSPSYSHAPCFHLTLTPQNGAHLILHKM